MGKHATTRHNIDAQLADELIERDTAVETLIACCNEITERNQRIDHLLAKRSEAGA